MRARGWQQPKKENKRVTYRNAHKIGIPRNTEGMWESKAGGNFKTDSEIISESGSLKMLDELLKP